MITNNDEIGGCNKQPYASFFRAAFAQPEVLTEFLETQLPPYLLQLIDFSKIEILPDNFINLDESRIATTLICKVPIADEAQYLIFLIEYQTTTIDAKLSLRILYDTAEIMQQHLKLYAKLPLVLPMVLYNGPAKL